MKLDGKEVQHSFITLTEGLPIYIKKSDMLFLYEHQTTENWYCLLRHHSINNY